MIELLFLIFSAGIIIPALFLLFLSESDYCPGLFLIIAGSVAGLFLFLNSPYLALAFIIVTIVLIPGLFILDKNYISENLNFATNHRGKKSGVLFFLIISGLLYYFIYTVSVPREIPGEFAVELVGGNTIQYFAQFFFEQYIAIIPLLSLMFVIIYVGSAQQIKAGEK